MRTFEKATLLVQIVSENMCPWALFKENVCNSKGGDVEFRKKLNACESRSDLEKLVNEYI